jgi:REP element-mobilizing transposase RayT
MKLYRNSQKRYYINNAVYFITSTTYERYPYFDNDILCGLFIHDLLICQKLKQFEILGYKINPEHIHLLIQPGKKYNYSDIMNSLKNNFSRNANRILGYENTVIPNTTAEHLKARARALAFGHDGFGFNENHIEILKSKFVDKHGKNHNIPPFKWQSSFYDHIIRNEFDYHNHLQYIKNQWIKHNLKENKWCYIIGQ